MTTTLIPDEEGTHEFSLMSAGLSRLLINGDLVIDNWTRQTPGDNYFGFGSTEVRSHMDLVAGRSYEIAVEYSSERTRGLKAVRLGYLPPVTADAIDNAVALAARSDVAVLFVGLNADWETEGFDRPHFGLSYTTFQYDNLQVSSNEFAPDQTLAVSVDVTNVGDRAGQETVQIYIRDQQSRLVRPEKELKGFAKIAVEPGETATVTINLDRTAFAYWDDAKHSWVAEAGEFDVLAGSSAADIHHQVTGRLTETAEFGGPRA